MKTSVLIVGGGIAGLLAFRQLKNQGIPVLLLEKKGLGGIQTLASQGIIHGGTKYALSGKLSDAASSVSAMTGVWSEYLKGNGIDLSSVKTLSEHHYLWTFGLGASLKMMVGSQMLSSQNRVLSAPEYPAFFQDPGFKGALCELDESVLDVQSLVRALVGEDQSDCLLSPEGRLVFEGGRAVAWESEAGRIEAEYFVLLAGEGNEALLPQPEILKMQRRALHMVMIKHPALEPIYIHGVGLGSLPIFTITSHWDGDSWIWYLGGKPAEDGVCLSDPEQWRKVQSLLTKYFDWKDPAIDFTKARYASVHLNRAEGFNEGKRPDSVKYATQENVFWGWPTKLTLAPLLIEKLREALPKDWKSKPVLSKVKDFSIAPWAKAPWENAVWEKI